MRLPSLGGLRAFEAAARNLSMKAAAVELFVTPSAVSQLVRTLEEELGVALFVRGHRRLTLTLAGRTLTPALRNAFTLIADTSDRVRSDPEGGLLRISATAFFAETWLLPRLPDLTQRHPAIDVHVTTALGLTSLQSGDADVAIRHGLGGYPAMVSDLIIAPPVVPVAAPSLVEQRGFPETPAELALWPRVHDADRGGWATWFASQGLAEAPSERGPSFDDTSLLRAAVIAGQGAGLLPAPLVSSLVGAGVLVELAAPILLGNFAYWLVVPEARRGRANVKAFRDWALEQARGG